MRRVALIVAGVLLAALLIALPAIGSNGASGTYMVRGIFDNGSFVVSGEEVRVAGATVGHGRVGRRLERPRDRQPRGRPARGARQGRRRHGDRRLAASRTSAPDASCLIRPQSLIGEKFIDCTPDPAARARDAPPPLAPEDPRRADRWRPVPPAAREQRQDRRPRSDPEHPAAALSRPVPADPQRARRRPRGPRPGPRRGHRPRQPGAAPDRPRPRHPRRSRTSSSPAWRATATACSSRSPINRAHITGFFHNAAIAGQATAERSPALEEGLRKFPETLRQVRLTSTKLKAFADEGTPLFTDLNRAAPGLSKATVNLPKFATAGDPGPPDPRRLRRRARVRSSPPPMACSPTWPPPPTARSPSATTSRPCSTRSRRPRASRA